MYVQKRNQNLIKKLSEIDKISRDRLKTKFNITKLVIKSSEVCTDTEDIENYEEKVGQIDR